MEDIYDVVIIGAGISGISAAYRLKSQLPSFKFTILEARGALGGTWDLFKYPGVRSDSDLYTFGFPWQPWPHPTAIANAPDIMQYLRDTAATHGIDHYIQYHKKLLAADWSSGQQLWKLTVDTDVEKEVLHTRFLILGSGYYDFHNPLNSSIPGLENFTGRVVHPQFWPDDIDYAGKKIIIIGSGATAVTLLPALTEKASSVTILQRSPSYVLVRPTSDFLESFAQRWLPDKLALKFCRWKNLLMPVLLFQWCRAFPEAAKELLRSETIKQLPSSIPHDPHFKPTYNPWQQRMGICPDGDFFRALRKGKGHIVTGQIKTMREERIALENGEELDADIIITATGLRIQIAGGAAISVDGEDIQLNEKFIWRSAMIQDIPNAALIIGYTNASWTPGADATAQLICRILKYMQRHRMTSVVPRVQDPSKLKVMPLLNLTSTYIMSANNVLPKAADVDPWRARRNYFVDYYFANFGDIKKGLEYSKASP